MVLPRILGEILVEEAWVQGEVLPYLEIKAIARVATTCRTGLGARVAPGKLQCSNLLASTSESLAIISATVSCHHVLAVEIECGTVDNWSMAALVLERLSNARKICLTGYDFVEFTDAQAQGMLRSLTESVASSQLQVLHLELMWVLRNTLIHRPAQVRLLRALEHTTQLRRLHLEFFGCILQSAQGSHTLAAIIGLQERLQHFRLFDYGPVVPPVLSAVGSLATALANTAAPTLKELSIQLSGPCRNDNLGVIAPSLQELSCLDSIDLSFSNNLIGVSKWSSASSFLPAQTKRLHLNHCDIVTISGLQYVASALKTLVHLECLNFRWNRFPEGGLDIIEKALRGALSLREFDIFECMQGRDAVQPVCSLIQNHSRLGYLHVGGQNATFDAGAFALLYPLCSLKDLTEVILNQLEPEQESAFKHEFGGRVKFITAPVD